MVPTSGGDHTVGRPAPRVADDQSCQLRRAGQGVVATASVGKVKKDAAAGRLTGDDLVRVGGATEWIPLRSHPQFSAHLSEAPSRVGGIRFDSSDPTTEEDAIATAQPVRGACHLHADRAAEYSCCHCSAALCPECRNRLQGEVFCENCTNELIATLEAEADAAPRQAGVTSRDETPAEALTSVPVTARTAPPPKEDTPTDVSVSSDQVAALNRAIYIELAMSYVLPWLGIGWLCAGRSATGLLLLAGGLFLVIVELLVLLKYQDVLPAFSEGLWLVIPALLLQNIIVGTLSACALRRAVTHVLPAAPKAA